MGSGDTAAGVLAVEPEVLLLDEPTAGPDPESPEGMVALLKGLHRAGAPSSS